MQRPLRLLAFMAPGDFMANTPLEFMLEGSSIVLDTMYVVPGTVLPEPPEPDVALAAIDESDETASVPRELSNLVKSWPRPVVNAPERVARLTRAATSELLKFATAISQSPYRIIEGRPFVAHMAISQHWMIHCLNANMREDAARRAEEARFMANFDGEFGARHAAAFQAIAERSGLEYLPVDCAETQDGKLLVFEVGTAMVVHSMDPLDLFRYKRPQMEKVFKAFQAMLHNAARAAQ